MRKIVVYSFLISLIFCLKTVNAEQFQDTSSGHDEKDWAILVGGVVSFPKLEEANQRIHNIEKFLKTISPEVQTFKDWDDITKGALLISVKRRIVSNLFLEKSKLWGEIGFAYAKGEIENSQSNLSTIYGPGAVANYSHNLEYKTWETVFKTTYDFPSVFKLTPTLALGVSYRHLDIRSYFKGEIPAISLSQVVDAKDNTENWVYMLSGGLKYTHSTGIFVEVVGEYNWCKMKGTLDVDSKGDQLYVVPPDYIVDLSGFSIITFIGKEF